MGNRPAREVIKWNEAQRNFLTLPAHNMAKPSMPGAIRVGVIFERRTPRQYCQMN
jgi:hypothetical protein